MFVQFGLSCHREVQIFHIGQGKLRVKPVRASGVEGSRKLLVCQMSRRTSSRQRGTPPGTQIADAPEYSVDLSSTVEKNGGEGNG